MRLPVVVAWLLWPLSLVFNAFVRMRAWCYGRGVLRQRRLNRVVISVGNLTVGGTGKTPMVIWLVERLRAEGKRVGILTRGYRRAGRSQEQGIPQSDEVALMRVHLGGKAQLGVGADRYAQGRVLERHGVECFILDDSFQHLRLARDCDIVLLDATDPFGGGHLLPAGRLREPKSALGRADIIVITRSEHAPAVEAIVRRYTAAPVFYAQTDLQGVFQHHPGTTELEEADWQNRIFFAFCGIGNPVAFFDDLGRWGFKIAGRAAFPDHHRYTQRDADEIERRARAAGAQALLTTDKDVFNCRAARFTLPAFCCRIALNVSEPEKFWQAVNETIQRKRAGAAR